jgi:hypothetical protein
MKGLLLIALAAVAQSVAPATPDNPYGVPPYSQMSPIARVTKMLQDMQANAIKEQKEDAALYQNMDCWCTTNNKQKDEAVKAAAQKIAELNAQSEELAASILMNQNIMKAADKEMEQNDRAQKEATAVREKENAEYTALEQELSGSMQQLNNAIKILSKVNKGGLLQKKQPSFLQVQGVVHSLHSHFASAQYGGRLQEDLLRMLAAFPDPSEDGHKSLIQSKGPGYKSYSSQSGAIFGILKQMQDDMGEDFAAAQAAEKEKQANYDKLIALKREEFKLAKERKMAAFQEMTQNKIDKANTDNDVLNTKKALSADQKFLVELKEKCETFDKDFEERSKTRNEEIVAIGEALKILTDENARDTFMKNSAIQFLQMSTAERQRRHQAIAFLRQRLMNGGASVALLKLTSALQLDAFKKVREAMTKMIADLQKQQKDEFNKNQECIAELRRNENERVDSNNTMEDLNAEIDKL